MSIIFQRGDAKTQRREDAEAREGCEAVGSLKKYLRRQKFLEKIKKKVVSPLVSNTNGAYNVPPICRTELVAI